MPLIKQTLQVQLKSDLFDIAKTAMNGFMDTLREQDPKALSQNEIAEKFADTWSDMFSNKISSAIHNYIKTATVTIPIGQLVAGTATAGVVAAATTTAGVGTLS